MNQCRTPPIAFANTNGIGYNHFPINRNFSPPGQGDAIPVGIVADIKRYKAFWQSLLEHIKRQ